MRTRSANASAAMWVLFPVILAVLASGCASEACLPEPKADETPPAVQLQVLYINLETGRQDSTLLAAGDSATTIWADPAEAVTVAYAGTDPEGMKRLQLGVTVQQTVGAGVQRRSPALDPIEASCPVERLEGEHTFARGAGPRSLLVGVIGENWLEQRASSPNLIIRQQKQR